MNVAIEDIKLKKATYYDVGEALRDLREEIDEEEADSDFEYCDGEWGSDIADVDP